MKTLYLVCNSHIDPVWLWEWEEGLAETITTFRTAARFCEEFDGFIFNHNESLLYQWVEEHEPSLFEKIRQLVREGKWYIMGGWYLQPDCNMPCGESLVRQILVGKRYFLEKFGVEPDTATNFDSFGHSRGLVQILEKSGYRNYLFCRPDKRWLSLPKDDFDWYGYDDSTICAHRAAEHYNSQKGKIKERINTWIQKNRRQPVGMLLWGIGDHGGGPSRKDLEDINSYPPVYQRWEILHGAPEFYFEHYGAETAFNDYYDHEFHESLNPFAVGCYTSMMRVKQQHRKLESQYFLTEKLLTIACSQGFMEYPSDKLRECLEDLLFCEFHDILPGSAIPQVEEYALRRLGHGLEILSRLRTKTLFRILAGEKPAEEDEFPVFVVNPHPVPFEQIVEIELQPTEPNFDKATLMIPQLVDNNGQKVACQVEKERSNLGQDFRKKIVFLAHAKASSIARYSCRLEPVDRNSRDFQGQEQSFTFDNGELRVCINPDTGLVDEYLVDDVNYLQPNSFQPLVIADTADSWGMNVNSFRDVIGHFSLMNEEESARFAGVDADHLKPIRIIENGPIRTIVEAFFRYNQSTMSIRYKLPRQGAELELEIRVYWNEKDKMLKLSVPTQFEKGDCEGQDMYGRETFYANGLEKVAQKWVMVHPRNHLHTLSLINDCTYGFDCKAGELRVSLLRSPAYSGHPSKDDHPITPQDRFEPRMDQGEHLYHFWIKGGVTESLSREVDNRALFRHETPPVLCCYPPGEGKQLQQGPILSNPAIQLAALKFAESGKGIVLRLFESTGKRGETTLSIPFLEFETELIFRPFELKTLYIDPDNRTFYSANLMEQPWKNIDDFDDYEDNEDFYDFYE